MRFFLLDRHHDATIRVPLQLVAAVVQTRTILFVPEILSFGLNDRHAAGDIVALLEEVGHKRC